MPRTFGALALLVLVASAPLAAAVVPMAEVRDVVVGGGETLAVAGNATEAWASYAYTTGEPVFAAYESSVPPPPASFHPLCVIAHYQLVCLLTETSDGLTEAGTLIGRDVPRFAAGTCVHLVSLGNDGAQNGYAAVASYLL